MPLEPRDHRVVEDAARPAKGEIGEAGHQEQREQQRTELGEADGIGHWVEQLRLDTLEGEQRKIGGDDDERGEEDRPRHLMGGERRVAFGERPLGVGFAPPQDRLGHHDRAVDDDSEVDRAEREQIGRDVEQVHQNEGGDHRERDGDADDDGATRAAEKQDEDDQHEADALEDGVRDLVDRRVDEVGAVDIGNDPHVVALEPLVELGDLGVDAVDHPRRVLAAQQQHRSLDRVVLAVVAENAVAFLVGELEACRDRAAASAIAVAAG